MIVTMLTDLTIMLQNRYFPSEEASNYSGTVSPKKPLHNFVSDLSLTTGTDGSTVDREQRQRPPTISVPVV